LSKKTNRLGDVEFTAAVMSNVTHEHLEFHGTWEQYRDDKANLFRFISNYWSNTCSSLSEPFGVANADDKSSSYFADVTNYKTFTYSVAGRAADISLVSKKSSAWGNWYRVYVSAFNEHIEIRDKLPGEFNVSNVLASLLTVSELLGILINEAASFAVKLKPLPGRMTPINKGQNFEVIVDYAHTPSSFEAVFPPLQERLKKTNNKIISLFGSAGERDTKKRSEQGKIASKYSDIIILTDEDPRGENSMTILEEIAQGIDTSSFKRDKNLFLIPDRPAAIRKALSFANAGDLVLLLGKGHENSIIYADRVIPYDEIAETKKALEELGAGKV
jgi:UDP-N-acetylmuramoyl-L-alanyl-D-glutamate--2,6-diaminopimelate ligase